MLSVKKNLATCVLLAALPGASHAGVMVELIHNGEFEESNINPTRWGRATNVPGWTNLMEPHIELFAEGFGTGGLKSPRTGSDTLATGQHAEITGDTQKGVLSTTIVIPMNILPGTEAMLSFDLWNRKGKGITLAFEAEKPQLQPQPPACELIDGVAGTCASQYNTRSSDDDPVNAALVAILGNDDPEPGDSTSILEEISDEAANTRWVRMERSFEVVAGASYQLRFGAMGGGTSGAHIDQVSLTVLTGKAPAPATLGLFALGLLMLCRKRIKQRAG